VVAIAYSLVFIIFSSFIVVVGIYNTYIWSNINFFNISSVPCISNSFFGKKLTFDICVT
jgi:hypothetical protein